MISLKYEKDDIVCVYPDLTFWIETNYMVLRDVVDVAFIES